MILYAACLGANMAQRPVEKHYGQRTLQERADGYLQINIPKAVTEEPRLGLEPGESVTVRGIIRSGGDAYVKIEGVSDE